MENESEFAREKRETPFESMPLNLKLYQCWPGGPWVRDPKDCHNLGSLLPELQIVSG
jgi:hypothetical protein